MARLLHPDQPEAQMQETEAWENGTSLEQSARPANRIVAANIPWPSTSTLVYGVWREPIVVLARVASAANAVRSMISET
jgi:hypothetical protein